MLASYTLNLSNVMSLRFVWGGSRTMSIGLDIQVDLLHWISTHARGTGGDHVFMHEGSLISCYVAREGGLVLLGLHVGPLVPWVSIGPWSLALGVPLAPWCPPGPCPWPLAWALVLAFRRCWCLFYGLAQGVQCTCCV